ncbi:MAG: 50S ribosomal protein L19e [Candidatus Diapherotrites archaeon]|nr:50S ribosomal protein L19e [Candidatus Diapherotrites archaeon]
MKTERAIEHAAEILKIGKSKIFVTAEGNTRIQDAITKDDIRTLIKEKLVQKRKDAALSHGRARILAEKKAKGRRRGLGKRKGLKSTRINRKKTWMNSVRALRRTLQELRTSNPKQVEKAGYQNLYRKIKGNYFRGKKYLQRYVTEGK